MRLSADRSAFLPAYLLCGTIIMVAVAVEIRQSRHGSYGLCRIYSYNVQMTPGITELAPGITHADERHFFVCCDDSGDEVSCHEQTFQSPRRHEGVTQYCEHYLVTSV